LSSFKDFDEPSAHGCTNAQKMTQNIKLCVHKRVPFLQEDDAIIKTQDIGAYRKIKALKPHSIPNNGGEQQNLHLPAKKNPPQNNFAKFSKESPKVYHPLKENNNKKSTKVCQKKKLTKENSNIICISDHIFLVCAIIVPAAIFIKKNTAKTHTQQSCTL
jgi:hypothetical protein